MEHMHLHPARRVEMEVVLDERLHWFSGVRIRVLCLIHDLLPGAGHLPGWVVRPADDE